MNKNIVHIPVTMLPGLYQLQATEPLLFEPLGRTICLTPKLLMMLISVVLHSINYKVEREKLPVEDVIKQAVQ